MAIINVPTPVYLTLRLDVLSGVIKDLAEASHQARDGISVRDVRLLLLVREHPGVTMSRLVELSFMEKTMVSKAVTSLTRAGLMERQVGETDARQIALALTRKGRGVAERARQYVIDATDGLMSILTPAQRAAFDDVLGQLTAHVLTLSSGNLDLLSQPAKPARKRVRKTPATADDLPSAAPAKKPRSTSGKSRT